MANDKTTGPVKGDIMRGPTADLTAPLDQLRDFYVWDGFKWVHASEQPVYVIDEPIEPGR